MPLADDLYRAADDTRRDMLALRNHRLRPLAHARAPLSPLDLLDIALTLTDNANRLSELAGRCRSEAAR